MVSLLFCFFLAKSRFVAAYMQMNYLPSGDAVGVEIEVSPVTLVGEDGVEADLTISFLLILIIVLIFLV